MPAAYRPEPPRRVSPGEHPRWEAALALLNHDLAATLPGAGPLRLLALPSDDEGQLEDVYVALPHGQWHGVSLYPESADDPASALQAITGAAQETVTECLRQAWPLCPEHTLGMHPRATGADLYWWCAGPRHRPPTPHLRAPVGALPG